jgi:hypothetical protein
MKKEVQDALETAIAGFEKRQDAEQQRLRERESLKLSGLEIERLLWSRRSRKSRRC